MEGPNQIHRHANMWNLEYIVNHVFFPPKLPQSNDDSIEHSDMFLEMLLRALEKFRDFSPVQEHPTWRACAEMVGDMSSLRSDTGGLLADNLGETLIKMRDKGLLALHIRGQNAGLIVRRSHSQYMFESMELSPTTKDVIETKGRLRRCFPGPAISIAHDRMADIGFRENLAQFLSQLDTETHETVMPIVVKANSTVTETRDTANPRFITELLTGILRAVGQPLDVPRVHKRTRDDVLWNDTLHPWRRSPLWLLLRVALQTSLVQDHGGQASHHRYKSFMIFFMTYLLECAHALDFPGDLLFVMTAKISRRVLKVEVTKECAWLQYTRRIVRKVQEDLTGRWNRLQVSPDPSGAQSGWNPRQLCFVNDVRLSLSNIRPYIAAVESRKRLSSSRTGLIPLCPPRTLQCSSELPDLTHTQCTAVDNLLIFVADLEFWVQECLDDWLTLNRSAEGSCVALKSVIDTYTGLAIPIYTGNPVDVSLMLLTVMGLWVALDKCAILHCPLLKDYDPGFPPGLFEPLLAPKKCHLERLHRIEKYLSKRKSSSNPSLPSVFGSIKSTGSFAVRYFDQSRDHQLLRRRIEKQAQAERDERISQLESLKREYQRLIQDSKTRSCEYVTRRRKRREVTSHSSSCEKCRLESRAESLMINIHEWSLPAKNLEAKAAVFELNVPSVVSAWRDTTYSILVDLLSGDPGFIPARSRATGKVYTLYGYDNLSKFSISVPGRLQIASIPKPFVVSHYKSMKISMASRDNICVNNGMSYSLYDSKTKNWATDLIDKCNIQEKCTHELQSSRYCGMQNAVSSTDHTSNEVLAKQHECPRGLTLHEFYDFWILRAGHRLQWRNIAVQLVTHSINFNDEETHVLIVQSIWQAGPASDGMVCRESHVDLEEEDFGISLLSTLEDSLNRIEGNWQSAPAVRTFTAIATRLLSLSCHDSVRQGCYRTLRRAREITLEWTRDIIKKVQAQLTEGYRSILYRRALEMALSCHGTFDVESQHIHHILGSSDDIAILTECAIAVHDLCPPTTDCLPQSTKSLLRRYSRLCHFLEPFVRRHSALSSGLNITVELLWAGYKPAGAWSALDAPNNRWVETKTSGGPGAPTMVVNYNILNGSLLVNGLPLTRLPPSYTLHRTYQRIFGEKVLEVVPSTMADMIFETRAKICGHQVSFRMHDSELVIRTKVYGHIYELIPDTALTRDFPDAFVQQYAHWLEVSTGRVEWRPLEHVWETTSNNWWMKREEIHYTLVKGDLRLIDVRSPTAKAVSLALGPLESTNHIHIFFNHMTRCLDIHLPRLKLDFFLTPNSLQLESKQFREMVVDENQSLRALTGLTNKLMLRGSRDSSRSVIIPHGDVTSERTDQHVSVRIKPDPSEQNVSYHFYQVDLTLGRLVDNGSLKSRLYKFYLHAITSHFLVDGLTGRTGTEEALSGLSLASTQSFLKLDCDEIDLLKLIAKLTPRREYYPKHLRVMQQIKWNEDIPPLAQHPSFSRFVNLIFNIASAQDIPGSLPPENIPTDEHLLERAAAREAVYRVHGFGAEDHKPGYDSVYVPRDRISENTRELDVCAIAKQVDDWSAGLQNHSHLLSEIEYWSRPVAGVSEESLLPLGYDVSWLDTPSNLLPGRWSALQDGYSPVRHRLKAAIEGQCWPFYKCPESSLPKWHDETFNEAEDRRRREHLSAREIQVEALTDRLIQQWPTPNPSEQDDTGCSTYINLDQALLGAQALFSTWYTNLEFKNYIAEAQDILNRLVTRIENPSFYSFSQPPEGYKPKLGHIRLDRFMQSEGPAILPVCSDSHQLWIRRRCGKEIDKSAVKALLTCRTSHPKGEYEKQYADDLLKSLESLREDEIYRLTKPLAELVPELKGFLERCKQNVDDNYRIFHSCIQSQSSAGEQLACDARMWPRLSPTSLLCHLARDKLPALSESWRRFLVSYGTAISALQRAHRLVKCSNNVSNLLSELQNSGHIGWEPMQYPDWLLLEIENDMLIRPVQAQVAREMISPLSSKNSVLQLNMGEGKSSVIVPIAAATLADTKKMVRVVVLKPLANQMFHLLVQKLGGLLNRRIYYIPISRSLKLTTESVAKIRKLFESCKRSGGVLLVQPEHILSFELMGFERLLSGDEEVGNSIIRTQRWLNEYSRDVLDESDEILSVRFELIYTIGAQHAVEFSPDRWAIIEAVLRIVSDCIDVVNKLLPGGLEVKLARQGGFPRIRILQAGAGEKLLEIVARKICDNGLRGIPVWTLPCDVREVLFKYLTDLSLAEAEAEILQATVFTAESVKTGVLLLRGLISGGVLNFALMHKRWRVDYGLDLTRTMLAVPYRAKDSPATRAEFSHPDVAIVLTCLSYYYGGLNDEQLRLSFEKLLLSDHAQEEYDAWVQDAPTLPLSYRQLRGINLSDGDQCSLHVFPSLRFAKGVIDFYMSNIVFPKDMKQFPYKLSSSGWDIARKKAFPTTGFSGTNDSRYVLPTSIHQSDLEEQRHTNATQLVCLLLPENTYYHIPRGTSNDGLDAETLLNEIAKSDPPVRVLLDVGAQVLELKNEQVAASWLQRVPSSKAMAAVFFNDDNELTVLTRYHTTESFMVSPYAKQMDKCLVYLDEAHTRGTDLRLPADYRAAVTLGPGLTKDRLVQACKRMRKLGEGQSVMFCAPMEVERKILDCSGKAVSDRVEVADVLRWSIQETSVHTKRSIPLWATQGIRYQRRHTMWSGLLNDPMGTPSLETVESLLEPEAQSLEKRYGLDRQSTGEEVLLSLSKEQSQLEAIRERCRRFGILSFDSTALQEEQERELSPENEREQQVEHPPTSEPLRHTISKEIRRFIKVGILDRSSQYLQPIFQTLGGTTAGESLELAAWPDYLLATKDFARTVRGPVGMNLGMFLRPVQWIACSRDSVTRECVILSPFEANELLPDIRKFKAVSLHVYSPRTSASMRSMEDLTAFAIPAVLTPRMKPAVTMQLNLFAGQLYLRCHEEYVLLCQFLGLASCAPNSKWVKIYGDGFIDPASRVIFDEIMAKQCRFLKSPIAFLKTLLNLRRKGQSLRRCHLGSILNGEPIHKGEF
ncbi:hypothetical protein MGYG_04630 [Nannizzia gypsea CBS 118893]|uniref:ubiquitinyl hydrolase 1 n=1 Tax=Arthroderma gypseum (strain ATCC MYA-4604 / CBS 118893) TaxID=535722 RepID=E4UU37_ARTGP|nr:hypothetical protein MGYG_04630 [Nannizzia gypsea CBS 118893]EFR01627.1 hypothetical protein MGYG_04630 [Nannizzia gypsea CBS 118893]